MTTGHDITTRIINRVLSDQMLGSKTTNRLVANYKSGVTVYEQRPASINVHDDLVKSLEKCRDYINSKYLNQQLTQPQVEDIFRALCDDVHWRLFMKNEKEAEVLDEIINNLVKPIEELTDSRGTFEQIRKNMRPKISM